MHLTPMRMTIEKINRIEILPSGELFLGINSDGKELYQFVYRDAAGVYWDRERKGFKSTEMLNWSAPSVEVTLEMGKDITWKNISESDKVLILAGGVAERPSGREPYHWS